MFSQQGFFNLLTEPLAVGFGLPLIYSKIEAGSEPEQITLFLYRYLTKEAKDVFAAYNELPDSHKSAPDAFSKVIRSAVAALMMREPAGLADFPTDERPLNVRAEQYFTILPEQDKGDLLQEFWDANLLTIWLTHQEARKPVVYSLTPFEQREQTAQGAKANAI